MHADTLSLDEQRQRRNLAILASGDDLRLGSTAALPLPAATLAGLRGDEAEVLRRFDSGLTAYVFQLRVDGQDYALKQARPECLVRNADGATSFLNELQCRQRIEALRAAPGGAERFAAVTHSYYASLREGVLLSEWVDGERVQYWNERQLRKVFAAGSEFLLAGLFEWDFSPGNLLDDGRQMRLFDFGYMYPFDPLRQFNSAGDGRSAPLFHLAERFETRNYFAYLLDLEQREGLAAALAAFRLEKTVAVDAYRQLQQHLAAAGADAAVVAWLHGYETRWQHALDGDLAALYLAEGWRSHVLDLDDDLRGQSCTPMTLRRVDWLLAALESNYAELAGMEAFFWHDAGQGRAALLADYQERRALAVQYQLS